MKIYNEDKTIELNKHDLDLEKGYLKPDKLFVAHHEAVEAQEAAYKERVEKLPNGSTQVWKDLVSPKIEAKEAYDEYEDIQIYVPFTAEELKERQLNDLRKDRKLLLAAFDKYKNNVDYGIEKETQVQHEDMIAWYEDLLDLEKSAFANIPQRVEYYIQKVREISKYS